MGGLYDRTAVAYDVIERSFGKDYATESTELLRLIRRWVPDIASVLDVGCGLGRHLMELTAALPEAQGVEPSEGMIEAAGRLHPGLHIQPGDMRSFDLGRTFDAVVCLWGTIGYMTTKADLDAAVTNMASHVRPGGALVVEGWFTPEQWPSGRMATHVTSEDGIGVGRLVASTASRDGRLSEMHMSYLVLERGSVSQFHEVHTQGLFTDAEYSAAFSQAGLVPVAPEGWPGNKMPLRLAVRPSTPSVPPGPRP